MELATPTASPFDVTPARSVPCPACLALDGDKAACARECNVEHCTEHGDEVCEDCGWRCPLDYCEHIHVRLANAAPGAGRRTYRLRHGDGATQVQAPTEDEARAEFKRARRRTGRRMVSVRSVEDVTDAPEPVDPFASGDPAEALAGIARAARNMRDAGVGS